MIKSRVDKETSFISEGVEAEFSPVFAEMTLSHSTDSK